MQSLPVVPAHQLTDDQIELVEKLTLRLMFQAVAQFADDARDIFARAQDREIEIAQDITREALDRFGGYPIRDRVYGTVDYKAARWMATPFGLIPQALFVDSKAEKSESSCTLQMSQVSLPVRFLHERQGVVFDEQGTLPIAYDLSLRGTIVSGITTVIVAHYYYRRPPDGNRVLKSITLAAVPNGRLAARYCPTDTDHIWRVGRNAPTLGERFRVRVAFSKLRDKALWRVQKIQVRDTGVEAEWADVDTGGTGTAVPILLDRES